MVPNSSTAQVTIADATNNPVVINISPTIDDLAVGAGNSVTLENGEVLSISGLGGSTLDLHGTLLLNSTGSFTDLALSGALTLTGGGTLTMSNQFANRIYGVTSDAALTIDAGTTIQGAGQIGINNSGFGFALTNNGTIDANQSAPLQVAPSNTVINSGTLEATAGGTLELIGTVNNAGGVILGTGAGSVVELNGSTINDGTLTTTSGGTVQNSGTATLNGVTISSGSTFTGVNGSVTTVQGTTTDHGTLLLNSTGSFTDLALSGALTLTGGGTLTMSNQFANRIYGVTSDAALTIDAGTTIQGAGQIGINNSGFGFALTNNGTIEANQSAPLQVAPSNTVINEGTFKVALGSTLDVIGDSNGLVQKQGASGTPLTQVDGTMEIPNGFKLEAGSLKGTGTVLGNVNNTGGAVAPGDSPGILTIQGDYMQSAEGAFDVFLAGLTPGTEYSQLDVTNNASLDGLIDVTKAESFNFKLHDLFTVLRFAGHTGDFTSFDYNGLACSGDGADIWN